MAENRIKMSHALAEIDQYEKVGELHTFSISYVKKDGTKGHKPLCRKSGNKIMTGETKTGTGYKPRIKENGLILLVDHTNNNAFSLKISLITHYNGLRIQH